MDLENTPGLKLNGPGGSEVLAKAYGKEGSLRWKHQGPIHYQAEFANAGNGVKFKTIYEFFNGSPYISITYSSDQNDPTRQLETAFYWPLGYLTKTDDQVEFLAASDDWIRMPHSGKKWSFLPFMDEKYVLVRQNDAGFAWVLLSSTFTKPPYIMIGSDSGYFITRFSEDHLIPVLVNKPETEFLYVAGVASEESMKKIVDGLKGNWIVKIQQNKK